MSKLSELSLAVAELKRCGEALIGVSETLADLFSSGDDTQTGDQTIVEVPEPERTLVSLEDVRAVLAEKSRGGLTVEVRALLEKHGAGKLSEIDPAKYFALLAEAKELGNG